MQKLAVLKISVETLHGLAKMLKHRLWPSLSLSQFVYMWIVQCTLSMFHWQKQMCALQPSIYNAGAFFFFTLEKPSKIFAPRVCFSRKVCELNFLLFFPFCHPFQHFFFFLFLFILFHLLSLAHTRYSICNRKLRNREKETRATGCEIEKPKRRKRVEM